ncbi:MAG: PTS IIA-like nitrogen regulatory protein PtsN [Rhizobiales bacterium]|nr:PTS IIA-like nitrogen regulatory protein PtsN [Hyphomicrobiales bacterium]
MDLSDLIKPEAIVPILKASSKKQALQELASHAAYLTGQDERIIFDVLLQRERLGSTGVGKGVAIPHGRLTGIDEIFGMFAGLAKPITFDAVDDEPVDLIFVLLAPEEAGADHLKALSRIARLLHEPGIAKSLRGCRDSAGLYSLLTQTAESNAA